jgi:hypothetical protein
MKVGDDRCRPQPGVRQVPQRDGERLQPLMPCERRHTMVPGISLLHQHLPGVRWEAGAVIAKVEPPLSCNTLILLKIWLY